MPTVHVDQSSNLSVSRTPVVSRRYPRKRKLDSDELRFFYSTDKVVDFDSFNVEHSTKYFNFKDFAVVYSVIIWYSIEKMESFLS